MYRMLDEMDGKQARRTGNSSPLGLLFDHGCDAFSTGILCLVIAKCMQTGNSVAMDLLLIATLSSFHFCTLEEYYTGGLFLPPFNAISDGSIGFIGLFIYCGLFGNEWSQEIVYKEVRFVDVFVYVAIFINTFIVIMNIKGIFTHQKKENQLRSNHQHRRYHGRNLSGQRFSGTNNRLRASDVPFVWNLRTHFSLVRGNGSLMLVDAALDLLRTSEPRVKEEVLSLEE